DPLLQDLEDQVLLFESGVLGQAFLLGGFEKLRHGHVLQLGDVRTSALDFFVAGVDFLVEIVEVIVCIAGKASGWMDRRRSWGLVIVVAIDRRSAPRRWFSGFAATLGIGHGQNLLLGTKGWLWKRAARLR